VGIRRWLRKIERDSRESADTLILLDTQTGEEFEVPRTAFLLILAAFDEEAEVDPVVVPLLDRLDRLVIRDTGERFWLSDQTHTGRAAANTMSEE
jgi:hypothetical protein